MLHVARRKEKSAPAVRRSDLAKASHSLTIRKAVSDDLRTILRIYNEGIEDRIATLETEPKTALNMAEWWHEHDDKYAVLVAVDAEEVIGWASLNQFSHRCAHASIADLSVYVARNQRGRGVGSVLLSALDREARLCGFHKIVLHALDDNEVGKRLYRRCGYSEVGVFRQHGTLDGRFVDVVAMEKLLE